MRPLLRDPLTHFVILGLCAFVVYGALSSISGSDPAIVVSRTDVDRMRAAWAEQWGREPTTTELKARIDAWVQEEILYREALALGLDRDDTIVRRRLAQKMEFLASDSGAPAAPDPVALGAFLEANRADFQEPGRVSFEQVYLSPDRRGESIAPDARRLLAALRDGAAPEALGDRLMLGRRHERLSQDRVAGLFGDAFARALEELPVGVWEGPVSSGYGLHLVRVAAREPPRDPSLDEIRQRVVAEWRAREREARLEAFHRELRERYEVRIEGPAELRPTPTSPR